MAELLRADLDLRDRYAAGEISRHGLAVARGHLENQLSDLVFPPKANVTNEVSVHGSRVTSVQERSMLKRGLRRLDGPNSGTYF